MDITPVATPRRPTAHGGVKSAVRVIMILELFDDVKRPLTAKDVAGRLGLAPSSTFGFTDEHDLHTYTQRLWSWRDEFGSEAEWNICLGRLVCGLGSAALWPLVTREGATALEGSAP